MDETEARRQFVGSWIIQILCAKLHAEKVTFASRYEHLGLCCNIEHANNFVEILPVYAEDGWTVRLLVMAERTVVARSSPFADETVVIYDIVGNELFIDCSSELDRQTK